MAGTNFTISFDPKLGKSVWKGFPDPNYVWEGDDSLVWEREITDDGGKNKTVKTYRDAIEIIADFKPESKVYGIDDVGGIERAAVKKFGGALKGFIWLDKVSGDGEVILPFVAPKIFVAIGERLKPNLIELSDDVHAENYYQVIEGKTHVHVKGFSGVGGAGQWAATALIAQYNMNEDGEIPNDNDELVTNGTFAGWTGDDPDDWTVQQESGNDPEVSEAATGEAHADTPTLGGGMCNMYTTGAIVYLYQDITLIVGRKYRVSINIDTVTAGALTRFYEKNHSMFSMAAISTTGLHTDYFVASHTDARLQMYVFTGTNDITFDDISLKLCAVEDSSGNDHDMLMQQDTDAIHVAGKINGAFDFDGSGDYGEIADHADFTPALTPFSINMWVYMHNASEFELATKGIPGTDGEWRFRIASSDKIYWILLDESNDKYIGRLCNTTLTAYQNQWIMLTATSDGGTASSGLKIYLNAEQIDDTDFEDLPFVSVESLNGPVWVGRYDDNYANGVIDNVTFFSVELTARQVQRLYDFRVKESIFCPNPNKIYNMNMLNNAIYGGVIG